MFPAQWSVSVGLTTMARRNKHCLESPPWAWDGYWVQSQTPGDGLSRDCYELKMHLKGRVNIKWNWYPVIHWDMILIQQRRDPGIWQLENPHQCFLRCSSSKDKGWACGYCFGCKDIKELMMLLFSVCFSEDPKTLTVSRAEKHDWDEYKLMIFPWCVSEYAYQDLNKHLNQ